MTKIHQIKSNKISKGLWIELDEEQSEQINGGRINIPNVNVNTITNIAVQTNVATVVGDNAFISQYNSFWRK
jgi:hypothetical protein